MNNQRTIPVIGLVGGIGSGKSAAAEIFRSLGCLVIDADKVGHQVLELPEVAQSLKKVFGGEIFDSEGKIFRPALGARVFGDTTGENLRKLEAVVHPIMKNRFRETIESAAKSGEKAVVLDAAVLFEAGWDSLCSCVVFVDAPAELRRQRVMQTRNWDENKWQEREKSQISLDKKASRCCYKLSNDSNISHLTLQVKNLLDRIII